MTTCVAHLGGEFNSAAAMTKALQVCCRGEVGRCGGAWRGWPAGRRVTVRLCLDWGGVTVRVPCDRRGFLGSGFGLLDGDVGFPDFLDLSNLVAKVDEEFPGSVGACRGSDIVVSKRVGRSMKDAASPRV